MVLPQTILFPQAMLPLYIFEPRYRKMLADALRTHRMLTVAMQRPGRIRETPARVAGLGLIRASVSNRDGTSHLVLQGLSRVELAETVRYQPYRVHRIRPLQASAGNSVGVDALVARVRELVAERLEQGFALPFALPRKPSAGEADEMDDVASQAGVRFAEHLNQLTDADLVADLVTCALLSRAEDRQTVLETVEIPHRLKRVIHFLMAEIRRHRKK